ncbi:ATP-binding protein [Streptomyces albidoflavus]|uniref:ATP-binding protein n=1 Tax=Streptomyces albidoflavus TaxID=1886 RepID=UPI0033F08A5E
MSVLAKPGIEIEWAGEFPMRRDSVSEARRTVSRLLPRLTWAGDRDDAVLVVSELATNAVLHAPANGASSFLLELAHLSDGALMVAVSDHGDGPDRLPCGLPAEDAESGRGLYLVQQLGARVVSEKSPSGGKRIAALLPPSKEL